MRTPPSLYLVGLLAFFMVTEPVFAQLPTRGELVFQKYEEDRAKGIASLNKRYIAAFEKELDIAIAAKELEEANAIHLKIQTLKAEAEELGNPKVTKVSSTEAKTSDPDFLVGKKLGVPHTGDATKMAYYSFHEDGKALWLSLGNQSVERAYKPTGRAREFLLWWPDRADGLGTFIINLAADGKTATVTERSSNAIINGIIEDAD